jgi:hypothetical protein
MLVTSGFFFAYECLKRRYSSVELVALTSDESGGGLRERFRNRPQAKWQAWSAHSAPSDAKTFILHSIVDCLFLNVSTIGKKHLRERGRS